MSIHRQASLFSRSPKLIAGLLTGAFAGIAGLITAIPLLLGTSSPVVAWLAAAAGLIGSSVLVYAVSFRFCQKANDMFNHLHVAHGEIMKGLASAAEFRDGATSTHTVRVGLYAQEIARELNLGDDICETIAVAAQLHDIGKIAIPDAVLLKKGALDDEEREVIRKHVEYGGHLLRGANTPMLEMAKDIAWTHHERYDGAGYPKGISGNEIPISGRIVAVADVFDALVCRRSYKGAWTIENARDEISAHAGTQFDPSVVAAFERAFWRCASIAASADHAEQVSAKAASPSTVDVEIPGTASGQAA